MSCPHCDRYERQIIRLTRELREHADELLEWRRQAGEGPDHEGPRLAWMRRELGLPRGPGRILACLMDVSPRLVPRAKLFDLVDHDDRVVEIDAKVVDVQLVRLRRALAAAGYPDAISTVWGQGWSIDKAVAAVITERFQASQ